MTLQEWLQATTKAIPGHDLLDIRERLECNDGFSLSVQAGQSHYCAPRDNAGPWTHVELGYPSAACRTLLPFAEDRKCPTETKTASVPLRLSTRRCRWRRWSASFDGTEGYARR